LSGSTGWESAKPFGYPTSWGNRDNQLAEELGVGPDAYGEDVNDVVCRVSYCVTESDFGKAEHLNALLSSFSVATSN
jgi:hypothetical protein